MLRAGLQSKRRGRHRKVLFFRHCPPCVAAERCCRQRWSHRVRRANQRRTKASCTPPKSSAARRRPVERGRWRAGSRADGALRGGRRRSRPRPTTAPSPSPTIESEEIILEALARVAPGIPVIAEEAVTAGRIPIIARPFFLVDPLDGTKGFIRGPRRVHGQYRPDRRRTALCSGWSMRRHWPTSMSPWAPTRP